jgi:hypothetical protein
MEFYELPKTEQQALKRAFPDHPAIPQLAGMGKVYKRGSWVLIEVQEMFFRSKLGDAVFEQDGGGSTTPTASSDPSRPKRNRFEHKSITSRRK